MSIPLGNGDKKHEGKEGSLLIPPISAELSSPPNKSSLIPQGCVEYPPYAHAAPYTSLIIILTTFIIISIDLSPSQHDAVLGGQTQCLSHVLHFTNADKC